MSFSVAKSLQLPPLTAFLNLLQVEMMPLWVG
jgi:hypothetical protein